MKGLGVGPGGYGARLPCFSRKSLDKTKRDKMKTRGADILYSANSDYVYRIPMWEREKLTKEGT